MRNESRKSGSGRGGKKPVAERRHGAYRLLLHVTYDVRELIPELVGDGALPKTNSQARKWRDAIDEKLPAWGRDTVLPAIKEHVVDTGVGGKFTGEGANIYIDYDPLAMGTDYVPPRVKIEFGARSTGEPFEERQIT